MNRPIVEDVVSLLDESILIEINDLSNYSDKEIVFLVHLEQLMIVEETPIIYKPKLHDEYINIYNLATVVQSFGGFEQVKVNKQWKNVSRMMGVKQAHVSTFKSLKHSYTRYIEPFLEHIHSVTSKPCCEHFNKPLYASINSYIFNHFTYTDNPPTQTPSPAHSPNQQSNASKISVLPKRNKTIRKTGTEKRSNRISTSSEEEITSDSNYSSHLRRSPSPEIKKKVNIERSQLLKDQEYHAGDKIHVKYHKMKKTYEATVMDVKKVDKKRKILVHYYGWNDSYDEWISTNRIVSRVISPSLQAQKKGKRGRRPKIPQAVTPAPTTTQQKEESSAEQKRKSRSTYNSLQDEYIEAALVNSLKGIFCHYYLLNIERLQLFPMILLINLDINYLALNQHSLNLIQWF
uniref:AT-rich interactive domain-containing protein 4A (Trinotate prediction) n=1 Tax=Myxobolus squamalis TaxID=59785 RepID=A0A6B2FVX4_MYXSQ